VVRLLGGVGFERLHQNVGIEDIDTHRCESDVGGTRRGARLFRFLLEADDPLLIVDHHDAKAGGVGERHFDCRERDRRAPLLVDAQHARVVHFVDVIARQDDHVARVLPDD
jgi:hypothetical protein